MTKYLSGGWACDLILDCTTQTGSFSYRISIFDYLFCHGKDNAGGNDFSERERTAGEEEEEEEERVDKISVARALQIQRPKKVLIE